MVLTPEQITSNIVNLLSTKTLASKYFLNGKKATYIMYDESSSINRMCDFYAADSEVIMYNNLSDAILGCESVRRQLIENGITSSQLRCETVNGYFGHMVGLHRLS